MNNNLFKQRCEVIVTTMRTLNIKAMTTFKHRSIRAIVAPNEIINSVSAKPASLIDSVQNKYLSPFEANSYCWVYMKMDFSANNVSHIYYYCKNIPEGIRMASSLLNVEIIQDVSVLFDNKKKCDYAETIYTFTSLDECIEFIINEEH